MAGIDQDSGLWPGGLRHEESHAPVGDVGVIEGGLEGLVFDQHPVSRVQAAMSLAKPFLEPLLSLPDVGGPGIVTAVGEPDREIAAPQGMLDLDAVEDML